MSGRNLRSTTSLPGDISIYLLEHSMTNMTGEADNIEAEGGSSTSALNEMQIMMANLAGDPNKLCELLVQNLTMANESNKQMQKILLENQTKGNISAVNKLDNCPVKGKYSSLDAWLLEVELWNDSNVSSCESDSLNAKKYLKFMSSVKESEECEDLQKLVQVEFKENKDFDRKSKTIIKDMVDIIRKKLDKSDLEKCSDAWVQFINIKQEVNETAHDYLVRFEQVETLLKNSKIILPERALAIHLLNKSSLEAQSKENVLTRTNLDDEIEIYNSLKKAVREMKSALTQSDIEKDSEIKAYYTSDRSKNR